MNKTHIEENVIEINEWSKELGDFFLFLPPSKNYTFDIETMGLDPLSNQLLMIGLKDLRNNFYIIFLGKEITIIKNFLKYVENFTDNNENVTLYGHYINGFDWPFLRIKYLNHKILPEIHTNFCDTYYVAKKIFPDLVSYSLDNLCRHFEIPGKFEINGKIVPELWKSGKTNIVKEHLIDDLEKVSKLVEFIKREGGEKNGG